MTRFNSTFKIKSAKLKPRRSSFSAKRTSISQKPRKALRAGKKTKAWDATRRKLKVESERSGLITCELRGIVLHECSYDNFLGYAHDAKRRKLSREDLKRAILICNNAHDVIEFWSPEEMKRIVNDTIAARKIAA